MSKFKVGDKVIATDGYSTINLSNLEVTDIMLHWIYNKTKLIVLSYDNNDRTYSIAEYVNPKHKDLYWFHENDLTIYGHPINDLNKLLYPDYVEKDGLLVPKDN